jgi:flagellar assembly protein FliH
VVKKSVEGRIPADSLTSMKSWAFPELAGRHVVRSPFKDEEPQQPPVVRQNQRVSDGPLTVGEIEELREQARQDGLAQGLEEGRQQGLNQGQEQGRKEGYQAAYQQAEAEINDLKARLMQMMSSLEKPLLEQAQGLEQAVLRLVVDTSEAVVKQELASRPELVQQAVKEALDSLPQQPQQLCFYVHPDDESVLQQLREQLRAGWEIATDAAVSRGGLRARGECSYLEYSVEKRFSQVVEQLLAHHAGIAADPEG